MVDAKNNNNDRIGSIFNQMQVHNQQRIHAQMKVDDQKRKENNTRRVPMLPSALKFIDWNQEITPPQPIVEFVSCPLCNKMFSTIDIESHANQCIDTSLAITDSLGDTLLHYNHFSSKKRSIKFIEDVVVVTDQGDRMDISTTENINAPLCSNIELIHRDFLLECTICEKKFSSEHARNNHRTECLDVKMVQLSTMLSRYGILNLLRVFIPAIKTIQRLPIRDGKGRCVIFYDFDKRLRVVDEENVGPRIIHLKHMCTKKILSLIDSESDPARLVHGYYSMFRNGFSFLACMCMLSLSHKLLDGKSNFEHLYLYKMPRHIRCNILSFFWTENEYKLSQEESIVFTLLDACMLEDHLPVIKDILDTHPMFCLQKIVDTVMRIHNHYRHLTKLSSNLLQLFKKYDVKLIVATHSFKKLTDKEQSFVRSIYIPALQL